MDFITNVADIEAETSVSSCLISSNVTHFCAVTTSLLRQTSLRLFGPTLYVSVEDHLALVYSLAGSVLNVIVPYRPNSHSRFEHAYMGDVRTDEACENFALHLDAIWASDQSNCRSASPIEKKGDYHVTGKFVPLRCCCCCCWHCHGRDVEPRVCFSFIPPKKVSDLCRSATQPPPSQVYVTSSITTNDGAHLPAFDLEAPVFACSKIRASGSCCFTCKIYTGSRLYITRQGSWIVGYKNATP